MKKTFNTENLRNLLDEKLKILENIKNNVNIQLLGNPIIIRDKKELGPVDTN